MEIRAVFSHQVADVNNAGDFAARWRGLPSRANRIINCDGNSCFLLADWATDEGVTGGHYDKKQNNVNTASPWLNWHRLYSSYKIKTPEPEEHLKLNSGKTSKHSTEKKKNVFYQTEIPVYFIFEENWTKMQHVKHSM